MGWKDNGGIACAVLIMGMVIKREMEIFGDRWRILKIEAL